jgi:tripartite ATP-independent transporter DctM subunit
MPMELNGILPLSMFAVLLALILTGYPVAFALSGTALVFALIGSGLGAFNLTDLGFIPTRVFGVVNNITLLAVPLFVFMGLVLEKAGIAEDLLKSMEGLFGKIRGSLAISVVLVGALLAASTGIVGATVVTMGVLSLPTMLQRGYDKSLACGTIAASGTLGQIIPPSIVLVLLGDLMNVDVGDLFIGSIIPGLLIVAFYIVYLVVVLRVKPELAPVSEVAPLRLSVRDFAVPMLAPLILMVVVLGSILFGIASPTESAACGATGALIIAAVRRRFSWTDLSRVMEKTAMITAMVFLILIGAQFFGVVFRGVHGDTFVSELILGLEVHPTVILVGIMALLFVLGFFLDFLEICFIVVPIVHPIMTRLGYDPLWLAVMVAVNLQTSFLTPPFGFALFYLKGVTPEGVTTSHIYRGIVPFVALQVACLVILALFPALILWLPGLSFH